MEDSNTDMAGQAAADAVLSALGRAAEASTTAAVGEGNEQQEAGVMSDGSEKEDLVEVVRAESETPVGRTGTAAEAVRLARKAEKVDGGAAAKEGGEGNIAFLLTALLLPLVIVGGIYGYAARTERLPGDGVTTVTNEAGKSARRADTAAGDPAIAPTASAADPAAQPKSAAGEDSTHPAETAPAPTTATAPVAPAEGVSAAAHGSMSAGSGEVHWGYDVATGPDKWGSLDPAFAACSTGQFQSPIDVPLVKGEPGPRFEYDYRTVSGEVINNGHTVLIKPAGESLLKVNGNDYGLEQLHFHTPSEHRIGGLSFPLEIHLVHKNAAGQRAVVAVMVEDGGLNDVLERLPVPHAGAAPLALDRAPLDLKSLLPENQAYFTFAGSLTTPPCSENVGWIVLSQPIKVPRGSINRFRQVLKDNNRPVQPLNGRMIYSSN